MLKIKTKNVSSLEKVLPEFSCSCGTKNEGTCLRGERFSYQVAYIGASDLYHSKWFKIDVESELSKNIKIYEVKSVPVFMTSYNSKFDNGYITRRPGIIPDILAEYDGTSTASPDFYKALWIAVEVGEDVLPKDYEIRICFSDPDDNSKLGESLFKLKVKNSVLPKQNLIFTQWLHCDCISSYYGVEPLSEKHWEYIESFVRLAAENGINMLLTPIFTPALDTKIGSERPTVQLVDIKYENGEYFFGFEKLSRWLKMCEKVGIEYIEIAHLFSQWGAEKTPKIVVFENGKYIKKFGWHTESYSEEYREFLSVFLPVLGEFLKKNWICDKVYFHISDEPNEKHIERYGKLYNFVKPYLKDFKFMDAVSEYEIYEKGYVETPVAVTDRISEFIGHNIKNLWAYYCCCQDNENLSNRFMAMPSSRNRVIAAQLYKYDIKGFLQWGYNFYYSQLSTKLINPYIINDADGGFPAGDAFSVYPGFGGAIPSLRLFVFNEALQDLRAMELAAEKVGRENIIRLIDLKGEVTFNDYPEGADYVLNLREEINRILD